MPPAHQIALLTERRYERPEATTAYVRNILEEDRLVTEALGRRGVACERLDWARGDVDWGRFDAAVFRTTWDYFERFAEFGAWLDRIEARTALWNPATTVRWNADKHYLLDLERQGVEIVPTTIIERGDHRHGLGDSMDRLDLDEAVFKPAVSGGALHTYRVDRAAVAALEPRFAGLVADRAMLLQPFLRDVLDRGEVTLIVVDGCYTHAVRKIGKPGDFRVQDDHGGTVHDYRPTETEIRFAERAVRACRPAPLYARVDLVRSDDTGRPLLMELELIEPELWFRFAPAAADHFAAALVARLESGSAA